MNPFYNPALFTAAEASLKGRLGDRCPATRVVLQLTEAEQNTLITVLDLVGPSTLEMAINLGKKGDSKGQSAMMHFGVDLAKMYTRVETGRLELMPADVATLNKLIETAGPSIMAASMDLAMAGKPDKAVGLVDTAIALADFKERMQKATDDLIEGLRAAAEDAEIERIRQQQKAA